MMCFLNLSNPFVMHFKGISTSTGSIFSYLYTVWRHSFFVLNLLFIKFTRNLQVLEFWMKDFPLTLRRYWSQYFQHFLFILKSYSLSVFLALCVGKKITGLRISTDCPLFSSGLNPSYLFRVYQWMEIIFCNFNVYMIEKRFPLRSNIITLYQN